MLHNSRLHQPFDEADLGIDLNKLYHEPTARAKYDGTKIVLEPSDNRKLMLGYLF